MTILKKRLLALVLLLALCVPMLAACGSSPSKKTVEKCAREALEAVLARDTPAIQALANPDYAGYFSEEEMAPYYLQYEAWGIRAGSRVGSMRLVNWSTDLDFPGGIGSEAVYEVSIAGVFYEYVVQVVETDAGVGMVFFDLSRLD